MNLLYDIMMPLTLTQQEYKNNEAKNSLSVKAILLIFLTRQYEALSYVSQVQSAFGCPLGVKYLYIRCLVFFCFMPIAEVNKLAVIVYFWVLPKLTRY
jgi:hypothetical protein